MPEKKYIVRAATSTDTSGIADLIRVSARRLSQAEYRAEQIEGALCGAFGVDTQLVEDGAYFVAEMNGQLVGCEGWSYRRTLFGGNSHSQPDATALDPANDAARIRAFFVHPSYARSGVATAILEQCEAAADLKVFSRFELMATLPGQKFYSVRGYSAGSMVEHDLGGGQRIEIVPMQKSLTKSSG